MPTPFLNYFIVNLLLILLRISKFEPLFFLFRVLTVKLDPVSSRIVSGDESGHLLIWPSNQRRQLTTRIDELEICQQEANFDENRRQESNFDENEMPSNILLMGSSKVTGFVLGLTGLQVAMQKGNLMALDFFG